MCVLFLTDVLMMSIAVATICAASHTKCGTCGISGMYIVLLQPLNQSISQLVCATVGKDNS